MSCALARIGPTPASRFADFSDAISRSASFSWATIRATRSATWSGCTLSVSASPITSERSLARCWNASIPTNASTRRMPEPTEDSALSASSPTCADCATWVPAHSSRDQPSPMSTTRTTSPYTSPNRPMAPDARASASGIRVADTPRSARIASLQSCSILAFWSSVTPWFQRKSSRM